MAKIEIDCESTLFCSGKITGDDLSSDNVCSWIIENFNTQKEEILAEIQSLEEEIESANDSEREELQNTLSELMNKKPELTLIINSVGGEHDHLVQIYDIIQLLDADIRTIVNGSALSAGAFLAISGTKGKRYITPNSRLMFHGVSIELGGKTSELKVDYEETERTNHQLTALIMKHTGMSLKEAQKYTDRDIYITPEEALNLKMIDEIVTKII